MNDLSHQARDGEVLVLRGPLPGLEEETGDDYIGDRLVCDDTPKGRGIAMVFPNDALYPHLSVYANIAFGLKLHGPRQHRSSTRSRVGR